MTFRGGSVFPEQTKQERGFTLDGAAASADDVTHIPAEFASSFFRSADMSRGAPRDPILDLYNGSSFSYCPTGSVVCLLASFNREPSCPSTKRLDQGFDHGRNFTTANNVIVKHRFASKAAQIGSG